METKNTPSRLDLGPYYSESHIRGARYQIITPSGEPFVARIVAEVPDLNEARAIIAASATIERLRKALDELLSAVDSLDDISLTRDVEPYKAQANWDDALATARNALAPLP